MNLTYTRPGELRKPDVEVLPDGRIRITRYIAAGHGDRDLSEVTQSFGATDSGLATALLVKKGMARVEGKDAIVKTWEVRNPTGETPVGNEDVQWGENGLKTVIADFVQMSTQPYTPQIVGTTASTYDPTCILRNEVMDDDGSTRQIRRFYINKGLINQVDEVRNNGALLLKTLVYLNDSPVPNPPTGYTLISTRVDNPNGLETTTYTFAKGNGLIEKNEETRLSGMLLRTTLTYLTDPSVTTQPTTDPFGTGGTIVGKDVRDADGHRVWTVTWVKAISTSNIIESKDVRNGGKLIIYSRQMLGAAPSAPAATIGGVVTLISDRTELQDGYTLYSRTWAEGVGQIGQDDEIRNNGALLIRTIRYLTDGSVSSNPITTPVGYTNVSYSYAEQDGYRLWTASYAKGDGQVGLADEVRNNGNLLLRTIRYLSSPSTSSNPITTPGGYVLISESYADQEGHRLWTASYAAGSGQIGQDDEQRNNGKLLVRTIRQLSAPSVGSNPITTPVGYVLVSSSYAEQDGHKLWTASYAQGSGQVSQEDERRNNGKLLIRTIRQLSAPSVGSNPIATPSGYILVSESYSDQDGHRAWTGSYAAGSGQISQQDDTRNNGNLLIRTIRHLTDPSTSSSPIATPSGYSLVSVSYEDASGYRVWTASFAKGDGIINSGTELRNKGKLAIYKTTKLGSAPTTPSPTIGGTVVLIDSNTRQQDGYTLYDYTWAEGYGTITSETDSRNQGKLKVYHIVSLGVNPSTPAATIGGTVVLIEDASREETGVTIYDKRWAEGKGVIEKHIQMRDGGLRLESWVSLGGSYDASFMLPPGIVMMKDNQDVDGVTRWTVTCMQSADGGDPTTYNYSTESYVKFNYPGRAGWTTLTRTISGVANYSKDLFLSPPVSSLVSATTVISYQTSPSIGPLSYPLWNPTQWATVVVSIDTLASNGQPKSVTQGLEGYTAWSGYSTFSITAGSPSYSSAMGYWMAASSSAVGAIFGGPTMPDGMTTYTLMASVEKEPAFIGYDGTLYYRKIVMQSNPPAPGGVTP